jgi:hypothetical protein
VCVGEAFASRYIKAYLRHLYPAMFEEAVQSVFTYLCYHFNYQFSFVANFKQILIAATKVFVVFLLSTNGYNNNNNNSFSKAHISINKCSQRHEAYVIVSTILYQIIVVHSQQ